MALLQTNVILQDAVEAVNGRLSTPASGNAYNRGCNAAYHANIIAYTGARSLRHRLFSYAGGRGADASGQRRPSWVVLNVYRLSLTARI